MCDKNKFYHKYDEYCKRNDPKMEAAYCRLIRSASEKASGGDEKLLNEACGGKDPDRCSYILSTPHCVFDEIRETGSSYDEMDYFFDRWHEALRCPRDNESIVLSALIVDSKDYDYAIEAVEMTGYMYGEHSNPADVVLYVYDEAKDEIVKEVVIFRGTERRFLDPESKNESEALFAKRFEDALGETIEVIESKDIFSLDNRITDVGFVAK